MTATYQQIATDYRLWGEFFDTGAEMSREEFDDMSVEEKVALQVAAFGPEVQERTEYADAEIVISANLDQASALVQYKVLGRDQEWLPTPFQTADGAHRADRLLELVNDWLDSQA